jgi:predicted HicB family RNase H-like nuclease
MPRPKTKTHTESTREYKKRTYTRVYVEVPKDTAAAFRVRCATDGTSMNRIINEWIRAYVDK